MGDEQPVAVKIIPGIGKSEVYLDGQDVSALLARATIDLAGGQLPKVFLELTPVALPEQIECDAVVFVTKEIKEDPADAMLTFLSNIDPDELDRCILEQMGGLGEAQTYGTVCLEVFRKWASGE